MKWLVNERKTKFLQSSWRMLRGHVIFVIVYIGTSLKTPNYIISENEFEIEIEFELVKAHDSKGTCSETHMVEWRNLHS